MKLRVLVQPRSATSKVVGIHGDRLKVRLKAPPVDGAANDALIRFLAAELGLARGGLAITAGATSRRKTISLPEGAMLPEEWIPAVGS